MKIVKNILSTIILIVVIVLGANFIDKNIPLVHNRYGFTRGENKLNKSKFTKDSKVKYSQKSSLCIENPEFNDASYMKTIDVKPNTPYKVTCMVKTENVIREEGNKITGANISIIESTEKSESLIGDNDWTQLTLYFNSKNRSQVQIGLRLGGYNGLAKGRCWFSDFKVEEGHNAENNTWNNLCLIYRNIDVNLNINGQIKSIKLSMTNKDVETIKDNIRRYQETAKTFSQAKIDVTYDVVVIDKPVTSLTYTESEGYYIAPEDIEKDLKKYLQQDNYDHIFVACRLTDQDIDSYIPINEDWLGLGGMDYLGTGYSLIRMPDSKKISQYIYSQGESFPEEVFLHEFLHTLERNQKEFGYEVPALHDYEKYGYKNERGIGLMKWYKDYMNKNIQYNGNYIGLENFVYTQKPVNETNFLHNRIIEQAI